MMSMTHISIGLATTLAITRPDKFQDYLPVIAGAAIGSIICDFDCRSSWIGDIYNYKHFCYLF